MLKFEHGRFCFEHRFLTASEGADSDIIVFFKPWREKLVGREFDVFENLAGIIGCADAFFSGNAKIIGRNKHLYSAFKLNNGKKPKSEKNASSAVRNNKIAVETF